METETIPERQKRLAKNRKAKWLRKQKIKKYGLPLADMNMTGKHGHHARGSANGRWNGGRWIHRDGYIAVSVPMGHHLRMKNGYAYWHQIVAEKVIGRPLAKNETVHHINGKVEDNRPSNLMVVDRSDHGKTSR